MHLILHDSDLGVGIGAQDCKLWYVSVVQHQPNKYVALAFHRVLRRRDEVKLGNLLDKAQQDVEILAVCARPDEAIREVRELIAHEHLGQLLSRTTYQLLQCLFVLLLYLLSCEMPGILRALHGEELEVVVLGEYLESLHDLLRRRIFFANRSDLPVVGATRIHQILQYLLGGLITSSTPIQL